MLLSFTDDHKLSDENSRHWRLCPLFSEEPRNTRHFQNIKIARTDLLLILDISKAETYTFVTHSLSHNDVWSLPSIYRLQQFTKEVTAGPCVRSLPSLGKRYCPHHKSYQPQRWTKKEKKGCLWDLCVFFVVVFWFVVFVGVFLGFCFVFVFACVCGFCRCFVFLFGWFAFRGFGEDRFVSLGKPGYTRISASTTICSLIPSVKGMYSNPPIYTYVPHYALEIRRVLGRTVSVAHNCVSFTQFKRTTVVLVANNLREIPFNSELFNITIFKTLSSFKLWI